MPGFEAQEEQSFETPFGSPSDAYIVGKLAGKHVAFLARHGRGHRISPSELNFRANIYGFKELGVERIISLSAVGSLKEEHSRSTSSSPISSSTAPAAASRRSSGKGWSPTSASPIPSARSSSEVASPLRRSRRGHREEGRHILVHGGSGIFDQRGVERLPELGHGRHRHDQPSGGETRARGRDLLRDHRDGHRLRLLAPGPRRGDGGPTSSPT